MWSAVRQASASIVCVGLCVPLFGNTAPPRIARFGTSCAMHHLSTTLVSGSFPMRAPPKAWLFTPIGVAGKLTTGFVPPASSSQCVALVWMNAWRSISCSCRPNVTRSTGRPNGSLATGSRSTKLSS